MNILNEIFFQYFPIINPSEDSTNKIINGNKGEHQS